MRLTNLSLGSGLRHVPEEEDQVRRQDAQVFALYQLQNRLCIHTSGKEAESAKRVRPGRSTTCMRPHSADARYSYSAKYIEGLENRLGRMESLLRLSGLLSQDDGGKTDLGTLEKRLADRSFVNGLNAANASSSQGQNTINTPNASGPQTQPITAPQSHQPSPRVDTHSMSPRTAATSPGSQKDETEVEALSDMMCSLVTNNCGETRYIGKVLLVSV